MCLNFHQFIFVFFSLFLILPPPSYTKALTDPLSSALSFVGPLFLSWRLILALVVTVFISSILEGLRRDEIHSFMGGVKKKKEGPCAVQYFIYGAVRSLMKPEVALSANV